MVELAPRLPVLMIVTFRPEFSLLVSIPLLLATEESRRDFVRTLHPSNAGRPAERAPKEKPSGPLAARLDV